MLAVDVIVPARAGSSRFPNKPLAQLCGRSVLQRVWQLARAVPGVGRVVVTSDDAAILRHAEAFGATTVHVDVPCRNGSERVAHAWAKLPHPAPLVVNLQGDAPLTPPALIEATVAAVQRQPDVALATPAVPLTGVTYEHFVAQKRGGRSSGTTVVCDVHGRALYFSKAVLPQLRQTLPQVAPALQHVGLYVFRAAALQRYLQLPPTPLEQQEQLEQLRWLEHGLPLQVVQVPLAGRTLWSIDHPEDLARAEAIVRREGELT